MLFLLKKIEVSMMNLCHVFEALKCDCKAWCNEVFINLSSNKI